MNYLKKKLLFKPILDEYFYKSLKKKPLIICDIGSQGGLNEKWSFLGNLKYVYSFDPFNSETQKDNKKQVFNFGLFSKKTVKKFFIQSNNEASSFFQPNTTLLDQYENFNDHKTINSKKISVTTLNSLYKEIQNIDFLKIDTEGSEYEILKGSNNYLNDILAIEIEVQYIQRYKKTKVFSEIINFLFKYDFEVFNMNNFSWKKNIKGYANSKSQLIWADTILIKNILSKHYSSKFYLNKLDKLILILVIHKHFDTCSYILNSLHNSQKIKLSSFKLLSSFVSQNYKRYLLKRKILILFLFLMIIISPLTIFLKVRVKYYSFLSFIMSELNYY